MTARRPLSPDELQAATGIDDDGLRRLAAYLDLLAKWQRRINLVGRATLADPWRRHVLDSAQLMPLLPAGCRTVLDIGSGAGFPGLVLAVMGASGVHLVESDGRKCAFLGEVMRVTGAAAQVHESRIEDLAPFPCDAITARALAPLDRLLAYALPFCRRGTRCLFLKGRNAERELTDCEKSWMIKTTRIKSLSDSSGVILQLEGICRRHDR